MSNGLGVKEISIVDFQFLYYKYKNLLRCGRLKQLSFNGNDTTMIYYTLKEIEGFSKKGTIPTCICFDSKAKKKETSDTYKKNRTQTLDCTDFDMIDSIRCIANEVGYAVYKEEGYEADDLVASVAEVAYNDYDIIHVYTVDKDLLQLVNDKVRVHLYRTGKGYMEVNKENFEVMSESLFKTYIPFNLVKVFKCMCGDSSDNIKGIMKFGPAAFSKWLYCTTLDTDKCNEVDYIKQIFASSLSESQYEQAVEALELVQFRDIKTQIPDELGTMGDRSSYLKYGMESFLK